MVMFLDYDGVVNTIQWVYNKETNKYENNYGYPRQGKVNNWQAVQWISELCQKFNIDIVVTSTWRMWENYKECLINGGLRRDIKILGRISSADGWLSRAEQIQRYLVEHPEINNKFIIIDDDYVDMMPFNYDNAKHFIQCSTNAGFGLEEFEKAKEIVENLLKGE